MKNWKYGGKNSKEAKPECLFIMDFRVHSNAIEWKQKHEYFCWTSFLLLNWHIVGQTTNYFSPQIPKYFEQFHIIWARAKIFCIPPLETQQSYVKVRKLQNEIMKWSHSPKYERKILKNPALSCDFKFSFWNFLTFTYCHWHNSSHHYYPFTELEKSNM